MKKKLLALSLTIAISGLSHSAFAEDETGNSAAGKEKAATCAGCHGENGNSMVPTFPKLAQQHASYLINQLHYFKGGSRITRDDPVMSPIALALSEQDIADLAVYFSEQTISDNPPPSLPVDEDSTDGPKTEDEAKEMMANFLKLGSNIYRNGDLKNEVSACIACHGPTGEGNRPGAFPALRSQHADYLIKTLNDFKTGARGKNPENMMYWIAKKMTDEDIKAVAYYISTMK
jgi:cytochrome c553